MTKPEAHIGFHLMVAFNLPGRKRLRTFLNRLFDQESIPLEKLTYVFCDDGYLLDLNRRFLKHDYYTDIITFPSSRRKSDPVSGEVYISVDRVKENAGTLGISFREEMHRVIFHGALHLCHYGDKSKKERALMRTMENKCLKAYFG